MTELLPLFINLAGRRVVLVGGSHVAAAKLQQLLAARACVNVVAPFNCDDIAAAEARATARTTDDISIEQRAFLPSDLDEAWLVVAAATPAVNREVADAAEARHIFVNAADEQDGSSGEFHEQRQQFRHTNKKAREACASRASGLRWRLT
jgi:uroporphyrin-III C-methyltransferase/precorrin-2 dehydrogenase/sirohydrochlorin ferrochelatase